MRGIDKRVHDAIECRRTPLDVMREVNRREPILCVALIDQCLRYLVREGLAERTVEPGNPPTYRRVEQR